MTITAEYYTTDGKLLARMNVSRADIPRKNRSRYLSTKYHFVNEMFDHLFDMLCLYDDGKLIYIGKTFRWAFGRPTWKEVVQYVRGGQQ